MSKDFFALSVLDPLLNSDDSARMYRKLVRDDRLAMSSQGAFNFLGPNWDMKGPMLYTMRVDYFNDKTADQVIAAIESVLDDVRKNGITAAELAQAKTTMRSAFLDDMEAGGMPLFGRANLLGVFALFDDDPGRINTILGELDKVTLDDVKAAAAKWLVPANRTVIDSRPAAKPATGGLRNDSSAFAAPQLRRDRSRRRDRTHRPGRRRSRACAVNRCRPSVPSARSRRRRAWSARSRMAFA